MSKNDYWIISDDIQNDDICNDVFIELNDDFYNINLNNIFNNTNKENVLCVGQVQSGKTKNIEKIISYGIENGYNLIIFLAGITNLLLNQTIDRIKKSIKKDNIKFVESINKNIDLFIDLKYCNTIVIPILKGSHSIIKTFESIDKLNLTNKKVLIIDDECDYASINISINKASKIYCLLKELYERIYFGKLISFTGTPFANIMCSKNNIISPNRVVTLINYDKYCGLKYFNKNSDLNYIEFNATKKSINDDLLNDTLYIWFIGASCGLIKNELFKSELLINVDVENDRQKSLYNDIFKKIKIICKQPYSIKDDLRETYFKYFNNCDYKFDLVFDKYKEIINFFLNQEIEVKNKIVLLNSENKDSSNFKSGQHKFCIIISGFMASRGFTFENLTTELFLNVPSEKIAIDTLLQRCRWFGPRLLEDRNKYLRILMNEKTKKALLEAEKYLDVFIPGTSTIDIKRIYEKIHQLDKENDEVESTNGTKRK